MNIRFWGVRGSIPTPTTPTRIKSKISAILEQVTPEDIASAESREKFLAGLPPWLFGTVGGNSPCISVTFDDNDECIVFDCGSGLREMGVTHAAEKVKYPSTIFSCHIFTGITFRDFLSSDRLIIRLLKRLFIRPFPTWKKY